jgi:predicted exporter
MTIILWFPLLDRSRPRHQAARFLGIANKIWWFWEAQRPRGARFALSAVGLVVVLLGAVQLRFDDDIRRLQALPQDLQRQEAAIRRLTGLAGGSQFLVVRAASDEAALETEEALIPVLDGAVRDKWLSGYQAVASIVPSAQRQAQNRELVRDQLMVPMLRSYASEVGLPGLGSPVAGDDLTLGDIPNGLPLSYIRQLVLPAAPTGAIHLVLLNGVADFARLRQAVAGFSGVTAVDPVLDITQVLTEYRQRALLLLLISAVLMMPILLWRYGLTGTGRVLLAPVTAVVFTPALLSVLGMPFTFFTAMGLILVLSIGFDYAIFCRETPESQKDVTMLGTLLAMVTTLLSFGLLAFSDIFALRTFGLVLFIGTVVAFALSPLARDPPSR